MKYFSFCLAVVFLVGCGSGGPKEASGDTDLPAAVSSATIRQRTNTDPFAGTPQKKLGDDEVRVSLSVLPGDALVEVDKVPVRRRNGMVELVGKVGQRHLVSVILDAKSKVEKLVKIEATGVSPALIDAEEESKVKIGPAKGPAVFDVND